MEHISTLCDWQVLTLLRPCWYTQEIRKWKQIRKMPQDCFSPWQIKWPCSVPLQSHVNHIDFTHLSKAALQSRKYKLCFPAAVQLWWFSLVRLARGLKLVCYSSSSENVHINVKLFAVKKAGGMSYTKDLWGHLQWLHSLGHRRDTFGGILTLTVQYRSHENLIKILFQTWVQTSELYPTSLAWDRLCTISNMQSILI